MPVFMPCGLGLEWGIVNYPIAARAYFREKEGFGCHRFSGSELRAGTLHLPVLRKRRRWRRRMERGGGECICQGQALWKKPGSYPIELCSPLCSLLVSYAAHSVQRLSQLCLFCCGKGIPDQHLKGIRTGRTGAGLLNLQCISNS